MKLDVRTAAVLSDPTGKQLLLLRRSATKKLLPNKITGIGGRVEIEAGEGTDITASLMRELSEEVPQINMNQVSDFRLRLTTHQSRGDHIVVLFWYTGRLKEKLTDLRCSEGQLEWHDRSYLPRDEMAPAARDAIAFVASLPAEDKNLYDGIYDPHTYNLSIQSGV